MTENAEGEDSTSISTGRPADRGEEAGGFGELFLQNIDLHFEVSDLGRKELLCLLELG